MNQILEAMGGQVQHGGIDCVLIACGGFRQLRFEDGIDFMFDTRECRLIVCAPYPACYQGYSGHQVAVFNPNRKFPNNFNNRQIAERILLRDLTKCRQ